MVDCEYCGMALDPGTVQYAEVTREEALLSDLHVSCPECATAFDTVHRVG